MNIPTTVNRRIHQHHFSRLIGVGLLLATSSLSPAIAADPASATNSIESISASSVQGDQMVVKVLMSQPLAGAPAGIALNNPARIYFDFPNTANALGKSNQEVGEGELRNINIVQAGSRTRLVMNLSKPLAYDAKN